MLRYPRRSFPFARTLILLKVTLLSARRGYLPACGKSTTSRERSSPAILPWRPAPKKSCARYYFSLFVDADGTRITLYDVVTRVVHLSFSPNLSLLTPITALLFTLRFAGRATNCEPYIEKKKKSQRELGLNVFCCVCVLSRVIERSQVK